MADVIVIVGTSLLSMFVGIIVMAVIADRAHKAEITRLQEQIAESSRNYLLAVQTMEKAISDKDKELEKMQRVCETRNEEIQRMSRFNQRMRRGDG